MICKKCGNELPEGSHICPRCGVDQYSLQKEERDAANIVLKDDTASDGSIHDMERVMFEDFGRDENGLSESVYTNTGSGMRSDEGDGMSIPDFRIIQTTKETEDFSFSADNSVPAGSAGSSAKNAVYGGNDLKNNINVGLQPDGSAPGNKNELSAEESENDAVQESEINYYKSNTGLNKNNLNSPAGPHLSLEDGNASGKRRFSGLLLASIISFVLLAAVFIAYWFLPGTRYNRYMSKALTCIENSDYDAAADLYLKCVTVDPDKEEAYEAINVLRQETERLTYEYLTARDFENAISYARTSAKLINNEENSQEGDVILSNVYYEWGKELARLGEESADGIVTAAKEESLADEYISKVESGLSEGRELNRIDALLNEAALSAVEADKKQSYSDVFYKIESVAPDIKAYSTEFNGKYPALTEIGDLLIYWSYDHRSNSVQMRIVGLKNGVSDSSFSDTYFIGNLESENRTYEFFSSNWTDGCPDGEFYEIDFASLPADTADSNTVIITGIVSKGLYDGEIDHTIRGKTYKMKFVKGKVQVLDNVDPDGETKNVVGYNEDKSFWISYKDEQLEGIYGIRCIDYN